MLPYYFEHNFCPGMSRSIPCRKNNGPRRHGGEPNEPGFPGPWKMWDSPGCVFLDWKHKTKTHRHQIIGNMWLYTTGLASFPIVQSISRQIQIWYCVLSTYICNESMQSISIPVIQNIWSPTDIPMRIPFSAHGLLLHGTAQLRCASRYRKPQHRDERMWRGAIQCSQLTVIDYKW